MLERELYQWLLNVLQSQDAQEANRVFQMQVAAIESRALSELLREARKAYKQTENTVFLHVGRFLWDHSPFKQEQNPFIQNAAGWILYDLCFKQDGPVQEKRMICDEALANTAQQQYSPYEQFIWKMIDVLDQQPENTNELKLFYLNKLKPNLLDTAVFTTQDGRELASKKEKWYAQQSKLRFELKSYDTCIKASEALLNTMTNFHHDNDSWAKRRMALSYLALNEVDKAKQILENLLIRFDNTNIYADLMKIYCEEDQLGKAMGYGANAILNRAGEMKHKLRVLLKMAEMYEEQNEPRIAYSHYVLFQSVREREGWRATPEVAEKLEHYAAQGLEVIDQRGLKDIWEQVAKQIYSQSRGVVKNIIANGEAGFIESEQGEDIYFNKRSNRHLKKALTIGSEVVFYLKPSYDRRRERETVEAVYIQVV